MENIARPDGGDEPVTAPKTTSETTEADLLKRARAGDRKAFDMLQARLEAPLQRFIYRLIGQTREDEDLIREICVSLYLNLERIETAEHLRPFVFRVARNLCYRLLRRQGGRPFVSLEALPESTPALSFGRRNGAPSPEETVHQMLLLSEVQRAIDRLPEPQRLAMILYAEEEFSYAQIAAMLETDMGTVKSRIHYARKNLVKQLSPDLRAALNLQ